MKNNNDENNLKGYIYIMQNPYYKDEQYKVGYAIDPYDRAKQLSRSTGILGKFHVLKIFPVNNMRKYEDKIHYFLNEYRFSKDREFFEITYIKLLNAITDIIAIIERIDREDVISEKNNILKTDIIKLENVINKQPTSKFLQIAKNVLEKERKYLTPMEIWNMGEKYNLINKFNLHGKTPISTMASLLYSDIKNNINTIFIRSDVKPYKYSLKA